MQSKICFKCGAEKPLTDFYRHKAMADGHLNKCKECTKKDVLKHREDHIEKVREYDRSRPNREERNSARVERYQKDRKKDPMKYRSLQRAARESEPEKYKARTAVSNALRDGKLSKPSHCSRCGCEGIIEGHHESYDEGKWLEVIWVCSTCHDWYHSKYK